MSRASKRAVPYGGTDGSNPVPSSGESIANLFGWRNSAGRSNAELRRAMAAVPEIDQAYQCGEIDQLLILEVPADFVVGRIGRMRFRDTRQSFGPRQGSPFALG